MQSENELPKSWELCKVAEMGDLFRGINYKKDDASKAPKDRFLPILRANNINNNEINFDDLVYVPERLINGSQIISKGDIIFAMSSGSKHLVGKSAKARADFEGSFGAFCGLFRTNDSVNKAFVAYFFQGPYYKKVISKVSKGTNINNLKREHILGLDIPRPPIDEQERIVAKIEELFSELDAGVESLKKAQAQLKTYRQAVLKSAFEGALTNEAVPEGELHNGWERLTLGEVVSSVEYGSAAKSKKSGKVPVLRMGNIQNGRFDWSDLVFTDDDEEIEKYLLKKGDVLFNRTNSPEWVGKTAIFKGERAAIFAGYLIRINIIETLVDANYLTYYLNSSDAKIYGKTVMTFGVNQANINGTKLKTYPLNVCSLEEQHRIVEEIESRLSVCDKLEETIAASFNQSEALRQSILKQAFEGRLV